MVDWLPSLVNAGRAFVAIGIVEIFWIVTEWPNGAFAIVFAAVGVLLFAPRADQAYATAKSFTAGDVLATVFTAIIAFAVFLAMAVNFVPLLAPANQMSYDTVQFYNGALAIIASSGAAALSFHLLPPLSPAFRTRRLLELALRDLRRLATGHVPWTTEEWEGRMYARLTALADAAEPLQRSQLLTALSVGNGIIQLRRIVPRLSLGSDLDLALEALARGNSAIATARLALLDVRLAARPGAGSEASLALQARGSILAISGALIEHASYFDARAPE